MAPQEPDAPNLDISDGFEELNKQAGRSILIFCAFLAGALIGILLPIFLAA